MMKANPNIRLQRTVIPLLAVLLQCLDSDRKPMVGHYASGFLLKEDDGIYLYTCWHVVTGFDPRHIDLSKGLPTRRFLRISMQSSAKPQPFIETIGGRQELDLPLYQNSTPPFSPLWLQDEDHIPNLSLNEIGLHVPFWHDAVKLRLPNEVVVSDLQLATGSAGINFASSMLDIGERCLVVGYPHGFSAAGLDRPTPVALTRYVAGRDESPGFASRALLESIGAPGMSGGPVFVERDNLLCLAGLYTGALVPGAVDRNREGALGAVSDLFLVFAGHMPLSSTRSS